MTLGEYIIKWRAEHGLSQRQFAKLCDLSNGYTSMLEKGVNTSTGKPIIPTLQTMRKLAVGMGTTIHNMLSEVDDIVLDLGIDPREIEKQPADLGELSINEKAIILAFRSLPPDKQEFVLQMLSALPPPEVPLDLDE